MTTKQVSTLIDLTYDTNHCQDYDFVLLLLHGYSETSEHVYQKFATHLASHKTLTIAPNGLYPLVSRFPLQAKQENKKLLKGYAWYFYDGQTGQYLIDYTPAAKALGNLLSAINTKNKPVKVIGYSQGGYLAPFIYEYNQSIDHIIGINCSYREDLFDQSMSIRIDAIQGEDDPIIDTALAKRRHQDYLNRGAAGSFHLIPEQNHRLSLELCAKAIGLLNEEQ